MGEDFIIKRSGSGRGFDPADGEQGMSADGEVDAEGQVDPGGGRRGIGEVVEGGRA